MENIRNMAASEESLFLSCDDIKQEDLSEYDEYTSQHSSQAPEPTVKIKDEPLDEEKVFNPYTPARNYRDHLSNADFDDIGSKPSTSSNKASTSSKKHEYTILSQILGIPKSSRDNVKKEIGVLTSSTGNAIGDIGSNSSTNNVKEDKGLSDSSTENAKECDEMFNPYPPSQKEGDQLSNADFDEMYNKPSTSCNKTNTSSKKHEYTILSQILGLPKSSGDDVKEEIGVLTSSTGNANGDIKICNSSTNNVKEDIGLSDSSTENAKECDEMFNPYPPAQNNGDQLSNADFDEMYNKPSTSCHNMTSPSKKHEYTILSQILGIPKSSGDDVKEDKGVLTSSTGNAIEDVGLSDSSTGSVEEVQDNSRLPLAEAQPVPMKQLKVTKQNKDKPHKCVICAKGFIRLAHLRNHIQSHEKEKKRYTCAVCNKSYSMPAVLKQHMFIHTGEKPFKCGTCDKSFGDRSSLRKHTFIHTNEKPHKCEFCDKRFACATYLRIHTRIHTDERPYKCMICQRGFRQSMHLKKHISAHTS